MAETDTSPAALRALAEYWADDKPAGVHGDDPDAIDAIVRETDAKMAETIAALLALAAEKEAGAPAPDAEPLRFTYRNYKGDVADRSVLPRSVRFGSTEWHPEPQWLMLAYDVDKQADREFAMRDMSPVAPAPDGWIEWKGGTRPVAYDTFVDVRRRDGAEMTKTAHCVVWHHDDHPESDIVAYRLSKEG